MHKELKLTGSGGQGLILAGVILADAALMDGKNAVQSQSYGPEARGGASKAEVIIATGEIDFIKVQNTDMLLCLTQTAYDRYAKDAAALLIVDADIELKYHKPEEVVQIPIIYTAQVTLKRPMVANIVALGAVNARMNLVSKESLKKSVLTRVPKGTEELNEKALELGYSL
ncbi:MAG: 2-oxoacid:acceptor oxidoreductase family protein [Defluviitaleaceae bacterium]|nr:2-oxoacid:acceptor oxidoreductase family protein [Defluviitaleaceae bacterium]